MHDPRVGDGLAPKHFRVGRIAKVLNKRLDNPEIIRRAAEISMCFDTEAWMRRLCDLVQQLLYGK